MIGTSARPVGSSKAALNHTPVERASEGEAVGEFPRYEQWSDTSGAQDWRTPQQWLRHVARATTPFSTNHFDMPILTALHFCSNGKNLWKNSQPNSARCAL